MQKVQQLTAENRELHTMLEEPTAAEGAGRTPLGPEECARRILGAGAAATPR
jgi:hypothetical protein